MLPGWLTFTALMAAWAAPAVTGLTVKPVGGVRAQPQEQLTLPCGDRQRSGTVLFWHSPFGYHHPWDPHSSLDPVSMGHDGSLVISNTSALHSGLYYCLLWRPKGTTLWQYQLHVVAFRVRQEVRSPEDGPEIRPPQEEPEDGIRDWTEVRSEVAPEEGPKARPPQVGPEDESEDVSEFGPPQEEPDDGPEVQSGDGGTAGVSDGQFAAAVAASVLVTFVVGFTAGALARTYVLRCLAAVTKQLRSTGQQARQPDATDHRSEVTVVTVPAEYKNQAFEMGQVGPDESTPPPVKPQRSFCYRRGEERDTAIYLEGCDDVRTEEEREKGESEEGRKDEEGEEGRTEEGEEEEEESEVSSFSLLGDDGVSECETEEHREKDGGSREEEDGGSREEKDGMSREEKVGGRREEEDGMNREDKDGGGREEEDGGSREEEDGGSREEEDGMNREEKVGGSREEEDGMNREDKDGGSREEEDGGSREESEDEDETSRFSWAVDEGNQTERDGEKERGEETSEEEEDGEGRGGADGSRESDQSSEGDGNVPPSAPHPARRSRIIRLYQYDEDGRRYGHLADPPAEAPVPTPRLNQRSLSLTRLNAIMAAATTSPLDSRGDDEEEPRFHMDI